MIDQNGYEGHLTKVLIVDDDEHMRLAIEALLCEDPTLDVIGYAHDGAAAVYLAQRLQPDLIIMDLSMPNIDGVASTREICARQPDIAILTLSNYADPERACEIIEAGAMGYVVKAGARRYLLPAVRCVAAGDVFISPGISNRLMKEFHKYSREIPPEERII